MAPRRSPRAGLSPEGKRALLLSGARNSGGSAVFRHLHPVGLSCPFSHCLQFVCRFTCPSIQRSSISPSAIHYRILFSVRDLTSPLKLPPSNYLPLQPAAHSTFGAFPSLSSVNGSWRVASPPSLAWGWPRQQRSPALIAHLTRSQYSAFRPFANYSLVPLGKKATVACSLIPSRLPLSQLTVCSSFRSLSQRFHAFLAVHNMLTYSWEMEQKQED